MVMDMFIVMVVYAFRVVANGFNISEVPGSSRLPRYAFPYPHKDMGCNAWFAMENVYSRRPGFHMGVKEAIYLSFRKTQIRFWAYSLIQAINALNHNSS